MDLTALLLLEPGRTDALEWFVASCLCEGGVWRSPRTSDGIQLVRVLEHAPHALRVSGRIYEIDQTLRTFWLELERDASGARLVWSLYFDVVDSSSRRARNALDDHDRAEEIEWRVTVSGEAIVHDGALAIVPGSTRVLGPDDRDIEAVR